MNNIAKMAMIQQMARKEDEARMGEYHHDDMPESRRRRDSRGRYMEGDTEMRRYMEDDPEMRSYNGDMPESRFRDRRGREHYDDGRFAPMRNDGCIEWEDNDPQGLYPRIPPYMPRQEDRPGEMRQEDYSPEKRRANIHALPPSNLIGFMGRDERRMQHGEHREQEQRMGHSQGAKPFDQEMAKEWTGMMKNADGTAGAHWTREQTKPYMSQIGFKGEELEFWAVMNAMYSDYCAVLKRFGVDRPEVYAALAKAWLEDKDAVEDKAAAYFECIVEHE